MYGCSLFLSPVPTRITETSLTVAVPKENSFHYLCDDLAYGRTGFAEVDDKYILHEGLVTSSEVHHDRLFEQLNGVFAECIHLYAANLISSGGRGPA